MPLAYIKNSKHFFLNCNDCIRLFLELLFSIMWRIDFPINVPVPTFLVCFDKGRKIIVIWSDEYVKLLQTEIKINIFLKIQSKIKSISKKMCRASLYKLNIYFAERPYHTIWVYTLTHYVNIIPIYISRYAASEERFELWKSYEKCVAWKMCSFILYFAALGEMSVLIAMKTLFKFFFATSKGGNFLFIYSITTDNFISILTITSVYKVICLLGIVGLSLSVF